MTIHPRSTLKLTYLPTGRTIVVGIERSQHRNKQRGIDFLRSLLAAEYMGVHSDDLVAEYHLPDDDMECELEDYRVDVKHYTPLKPCPKCGADVENDRIDSLYPMNRERTRWNIVCKIHNCGCGYEIQGTDKELLIRRWNNDV